MSSNLFALIHLRPSSSGSACASSLRRSIRKPSPGCPQFIFSSSVRDLGVILQQELTFERHSHLLFRDCLTTSCNQDRLVSRSLTSIAPTPVHSYVFSRLDCCIALYLGPPAARIGHVTHYMRDALHWFNILQRIAYIGSLPCCGAALRARPWYIWKSLIRSTLNVQRRSSLRSSKQA